ncbi:hypothetical protein DRO37_06025 [Candidatus Bathyarchaeota archaeon]|nr:MAG: hypothetical protein DRO37_06025 [Candidatus Bathyarchaeota archaeon]
MSVPLVLMTRFFQLVRERKFAEAERILERIRARMELDNGRREFNRGYLDALNGIVLSFKSGSSGSYEFFCNLDLNDISALKRHYEDFKRNARGRFHAEYDRGYFSALTDFMRVIIDTIKRAGEAKNDANPEGS